MQQPAEQQPSPRRGGRVWWAIGAVVVLVAIACYVLMGSGLKPLPPSGPSTPQQVVTEVIDDTTSALVSSPPRLDHEETKASAAVDCANPNPAVSPSIHGRPGSLVEMLRTTEPWTTWQPFVAYGPKATHPTSFPCETEGMRLVIPPSARTLNYMDTAVIECPFEPVRMGNTTTLADLMLFNRFPRLEGPITALANVSGRARERYWAYYPSAFDPHCATCRGTLHLPSPLFSMRRWWKVAGWKFAALGGGDTRTRDSKTATTQPTLLGSLLYSKAPHTVLAMNRDELLGVGMDLVDEETVPSTLAQDVIYLHGSASAHSRARDFASAGMLRGVFLCLGGSSSSGDNATRAAAAEDANSAAFSEILLVVKKLGSITGDIGDSEEQLLLHRISFFLPRPGVYDFWRSLHTLVLTDDSLFGSDASRPFPVWEVRRMNLSPLAPAKENRHSSPCSQLTVADVMDHVKQPAARIRDDRQLPPQNGVTISAMRPPARLPYIPCHQLHFSKLLRDATALNNIDEFKIYWPTKCSIVGSRNKHCPFERRLADDALGQRRGGSSKSEEDEGSEEKPKAIIKERKSSSLATAVEGGDPLECRQRERTNVRVAIALSGFLRSFASTKDHIYDKLVRPHRATVFAVTWNVPGRVKKGEDIRPIIPVATMKKTVEELMDKMFLLETIADGQIVSDNHTAVARRLGGSTSGASSLSKRYVVEVLDWKSYARLLDAKAGLVKRNGFLHASLYFQQAQSLLLIARSSSTGGSVTGVAGSNKPFDVVIRTRFDIMPLVPLHFVPISHRHAEVGGHEKKDEGDAEPPSEGNARRRAKRINTLKDDDDDGRRSSTLYGINLGATCRLQGLDWPQSAVLEPGKILRHYADSRFKLFAWQTCDWIDVGLYRDMVQTYSGLYDWIIEHNVFGAAQFVEHGFFIDRDLAYQTLNLFVKILRHKSAPWG